MDFGSSDGLGSESLDTLDVLISRDTSTLLTDIEVEDINLCNDDGDLIRDHYSIECTIQQSTQLQNREIV